MASTSSNGCSAVKRASTSSIGAQQHWHFHGTELSCHHGRSEDEKNEENDVKPSMSGSSMVARGRACFVPQHLIDVLPRKIMKIPPSSVESEPQHKDIRMQWLSLLVLSWPVGLLVQT
jgi:hypothetical protein